MNTPSIALAIALSLATGCSTNAQVFADQPLVAKVKDGMSQAQVEQIGGKPLSTSARTIEPGTCNDYLLTQADRTQHYNVSFDGNGRVDHKSFMSCAEWSMAQKKAREPSSGGGGGGY